MKSDTRIKSWLTDQAWVAILVTFFTVVLGIVISEIQNRVGWVTLAISLVTVIGIYSIITWLHLKYVFSISLRLSYDIQEKIDNYIELDRVEKKGWILTVPQLVEFEKNTGAPEIWLISGDLVEDVVGEPFFDAVTQNLARGIRYRYFVPDRPEIHSRVSQIEKQRKTSERVQVTYLSSDFFFLVPDLDFVIYNPYCEDAVERVCYMGLPVPGEESHYEVKVSDDLVDLLIGKLMPLMEQADSNIKLPQL